jgi:hypothetical protein
LRAQRAVPKSRAMLWRNHLHFSSECLEHRAGSVGCSNCRRELMTTCSPNGRPAYCQLASLARASSARFTRTTCVLSSLRSHSSARFARATCVLSSLRSHDVRPQLGGPPFFFISPSPPMSNPKPSMKPETTDVTDKTALFFSSRRTLWCETRTLWRETRNHG